MIPSTVMPRELVLASREVDDLRWADRVAEHERRFNASPAAFRFTTLLLAVLGCAMVGGLLISGVAAAVWLVWRWLDGQSPSGVSLLLVMVTLLLSFSALRAMWVVAPAPKGRHVRRDQAPALFKMLDKVRGQLGGPRFDKLLVDGALHVAVVQCPRLGLLGCYRNTLVLGLPALLLLSPSQLACMVARELWHLRISKGGPMAWVYRIRRCWERLAESQQSAKGFAPVTEFVFRGFYAWFFPRFNARATVLCRQQELEADTAASLACGAQAMGEALIANELASHYLDEVFWPEVFARAHQGSELRQHPYGELRSRLMLSLTHPNAGTWLNKAYKKIQDKTDRWPSLRQRLDALDQQPKLPVPLVDNAAKVLLGKPIEVVLASLDSQWQIDNSAAWAQAVRDQSACAARLKALNEKRQLGPLSSAELAERAQCIEKAAGASDALPAWLEAHQVYPMSVEIALGLARLIDDHPNEVSPTQAFALWSLVAHSDSAFAVVACERCIAWLERHERPSEVQAWRLRLKDRLQREQEAQAERLDFERNPSFIPADLNRSQIQECLDVLIRERAVGCAYLVRQQTRTYPQRPFYVLMIERSRASKQPPPSQYGEQLRRKLKLPGDFTPSSTRTAASS